MIEFACGEYYWVRTAEIDWVIVKAQDGPSGQKRLVSLKKWDDKSILIHPSDILEAKWLPNPVTTNDLINAEITISFISTNLIDEDSLNNWNGRGSAISLEDYVRFMIQEGHLADIVNDFADPSLLSVRRIHHGNS